MFTFQGKVYIHFFQQQQHNSAMALKNTFCVKWESKSYMFKKMRFRLLKINPINMQKTITHSSSETLTVGIPPVLDFLLDRVKPLRCKN